MKIVDGFQFLTIFGESSNFRWLTGFWTPLCAGKQLFIKWFCQFCQFSEFISIESYLGEKSIVGYYRVRLHLMSDSFYLGKLGIG